MMSAKNVPFSFEEGSSTLVQLNFSKRRREPESGGLSVMSLKSSFTFSMNGPLQDSFVKGWASSPKISGCSSNWRSVQPGSPGIWSPPPSSLLPPPPSSLPSPPSSSFPPPRVFLRPPMGGPNPNARPGSQFFEWGLAGGVRCVPPGGVRVVHSCSLVDSQLFVADLQEASFPPQTF